MKSAYLVAFIIAAAVVVSPLAYSDPGHGTQVTQFRSTSDNAYGDACQGNVCYYFSAGVYDDNNGLQGYVSTQIYDYNISQSAYISCSGPAYANVVSVNQGNGNTSINATLDPVISDCYSFNASAPVTLQFVGQFDGNYRNSQNGTGKQTYFGGNYKYNFQSDSFRETFTGTNGFYSGTFTGYANTQRYTNRTQVK